MVGGSVSLLLECESFDGEMGFFGMLNVGVCYMLLFDMSWCVDYEVVCDCFIVVNLILYVYFNLVGVVLGLVLIYCFMLYVSCVIEFDVVGILLWYVVVDGMFFDFCCECVIGSDVGYDYNWLFDYLLDGVLYLVVCL